MTIAEALKQEGYQIGREEGLHEGVERGRYEGKLEGKLEVARQMLKGGMPQATVKQFTGLTESDIKILKK